MMRKLGDMLDAEEASWAQQKASLQTRVKKVVQECDALKNRNDELEKEGEGNDGEIERLKEEARRRG
ncbi:hypothetical protein DPSP01_004414 [Paraphaeosphaeria sporulosa]